MLKLHFLFRNGLTESGSSGTKGQRSHHFNELLVIDLNKARTLLAPSPLRAGWSSDSRSALFGHGGVSASSSRRAISTFTVSRPPNAVAWLMAYALGWRGRRNGSAQRKPATEHPPPPPKSFNRTGCCGSRSGGSQITLAGLIPAAPPLAPLCFWTPCSWRILSCSSRAVSSAAANTASPPPPPPRPFTSAVLMAATSLDPQALKKQKHFESLRGEN